MSTDSCHSTQIPGSGTNRGNRLLESLLPGYVAVDGRKIEDLKAFAKGLAAQLRFRTTTDTWEGDWLSFFDKGIVPDQRTDPHFALFLAFLQNYVLAQTDLNGLTKKHLDFFYRDVLRLNEKSAEADQAYLIIQLAKHVAEHLLPKNSTFKAGKDDIGKEITFKNQSDQVINKTEVASLKALFRDRNGRFYKSPVANSADGKGAQILHADGRWNPFGRPETLFPDSDRQSAILGFAISSPALVLEEGDRKITLTLLLRQQPGLLEKLKSLHLNSTFRFLLSGEKEWIEATVGFPTNEEEIDDQVLDFLNRANVWQDIAGLEPQAGPVFDNPEIGFHRPFMGYDIGEVTAKNILSKRNSLPRNRFTHLDQVDSVRGMGPDKIADLLFSFQTQKHELKDLGANGIELILKCHLIPDQDAVVGYSKEILLQKFSSSQPVMKIELADTLQSYAYAVLQVIELLSVKIDVSVKGVENLILQNDQTTLPVGKNINPFGFRPVLGSNFYIGSREVFSKSLNDLVIHFEWHGLPTDAEGFKGYYTGYSGNKSNASFEAKAYFLDDRSWGNSKKTIRLFSGLSAPAANQTYRLTNIDLGTIPSEPELEDFSTWSPASKRGFIKLSLHGSDFGHKEYPNLFASQVILKIGETDTVLPNEPYTPEVKSVKLDYTATDSFIPGKSNWNSFFHIGAFGEAKQEVNPGLLLPDYSHDGYLFIGLKDHLPGQSVQLLIHVLDGSANPEKAVPTVGWSYLSGNVWKTFNKLDLVLDETNGLIQTGLVGFTMPRYADTSHTILEDGMTWILATVAENSDAVPDFTHILAQAIRVTFEDQGNDPNRLAAALPAKTIAKLKISQAQVSKIDQPFASFGGKTQEASEDFYTRISERLRHKQRTITRWDYEHLVLEYFSEIYQVKTLNHTEYNGNLENYRALAPRHVTVVLVANVQNKNAIDPLRPKASVALIARVREFVLKICSAGIYLHVVNPVYEELQVKANVKFLAGMDRSLYAKKLEDDLKAFLSPWAFQSPEAFSFAGEIHSSVILHFVEKLSYVDYLTCFELYHIIKNPVDGVILSRTRVAEAKGSTGVSLLGSVGSIDTYGDHLITILETDDCECADNEVPATIDITSTEGSDMEEAFDT
ncbi:baseplate J/gp47 family protein [Dyadobacter fanqingshengii]|uniref:Baseplate J/gp47 family protein n=1 Tax=Dyadobacter fanqingshengii TaxID=2906443 RepID=A0A9X1P9G3_9BACT|nr:baseplate J/gp47 family protein [Dyadobacter fanqingshengii]MCF0039778.1 baseplate J/gp47 family protein [Dyadobacter fanqingshengii]USJ38459.1 baseplate J/gp47 family protein [Dyadobacter fanqingshengii]